MVNTLLFILSWQLSKALGWFLTLTKFFNMIKENLQLIYKLPDEKFAQKLCRQYLFKMSRYIFEVLFLGLLNKKSAQKLLDITLAQNIIDAALRQKRGVLLLVMHCGNWELVGQSLGRLGYPVYAVVNTAKEEKDLLLRLLNKNRLKNQVKLINTKTENLFRASLKAFKSNELVMLAADTGATDSDKNIPMDFLGHSVPIASGWATIALRAKPLILPMLSKTDGKHLAHQLCILDTLDPNNYNSEEDLLNAVLPLFEKFLKENPTEWFLPLSDSEMQKSFG